MKNQKIKKILEKGKNRNWEENWEEKKKGIAGRPTWVGRPVSLIPYVLN